MSTFYFRDDSMLIFSIMNWLDLSFSISHLVYFMETSISIFPFLNLKSITIMISPKLELMFQVIDINPFVFFMNTSVRIDDFFNLMLFTIIRPSSILLNLNSFRLLLGTWGIRLPLNINRLSSFFDYGLTIGLINNSLRGLLSWDYRFKLNWCFFDLVDDLGVCLRQSRLRNSMTADYLMSEYQRDEKRHDDKSFHDSHWFSMNRNYKVVLVFKLCCLIILH